MILFTEYYSFGTNSLFLLYGKIESRLNFYYTYATFKGINT